MNKVMHQQIATKVAAAICCIGLAWLALDYDSILCGVGAILAFIEAV